MNLTFEKLVQTGRLLLHFYQMERHDAAAKMCFGYRKYFSLFINIYLNEPLYSRSVFDKLIVY